MLQLLSRPLRAIFVIVLVPLLSACGDSGGTSDTAVAARPVPGIPARKVQFSDDYTMGELSVRHNSFIGGWDKSWTPLGSAKGLVDVPADHILMLTGSKTSKNLEFYGSLPGDALHTLFLVSTRLEDDQIAHLTGLTGLKVLALQTPKVTPAALSQLKALTSLDTLALVGDSWTDEVIPSLKELSQVKRFQFLSTAVTSTAESELTSAVPGCRVMVVQSTPDPSSVMKAMQDTLGSSDPAEMAERVKAMQGN